MLQNQRTVHTNRKYSKPLSNTKVAIPSLPRTITQIPFQVPNSTPPSFPNSPTFLPFKPQIFTPKLFSNANLGYPLKSSSRVSCSKGTPLHTLGSGLGKMCQ
ncbi:unnamed protein product [Coffea canephora]|uniref:Uncharacterized protein n=1 Tax=Coffea canephora TaxID=49390 RepID=A0A068URL9_COFCA|nr:unnamed protein product [Coffea canephora]